ncbi:MAG: hypothetical protein JXL80_05355 [Planctomycetes bacterium]|nr:hypothetical protein [Planctomycetota bacterium]
MKQSWTLIVSAVALLIASAGCSPDPLTPDERLQRALHENRNLQLERQELARRIAELAGGQTTMSPQQGVDRLDGGQALLDDPFRAVKVEFSRITGGLDTDGKPGDEGVRVVLLPMDKDDDVVKRAGSVEIDLFDLAATDGNQRVGHWDFTIDQAAHEWVSGFGASSYSFELTWPGGRQPQHRDLTVVVHFKTLDGRVLMAQRGVRVRLPGD